MRERSKIRDAWYGMGCGQGMVVAVGNDNNGGGYNTREGNEGKK